MMSSLSALQNEVAGLSDWEAQYLLSELRWRRRESEEKQQWQDICDKGTRADIIKAAQAYSGVHAIGLASDYDTVPHALELVAWAVRYHPRRPVMMRGSKAGKVWRYQLTENRNPNGYAAALFWRQFRASKVTAFERHDLPVWLDGLRLKIRDRYPHVTSAFCQRTEPRWQFSERGGCYLNGKARWLTVSEKANLKAMYDIVRKAATLEARLDALRAHRREQMAC